MVPLLIDEGLPGGQVAAALRRLDLDAHAVGDKGAPPRKSSDDINVEWCARRNAVLVTQDRGKKDRVILRLLDQHHVHAIFVYGDLRVAPPHELARALLSAERAIDDLATRKRGLVRHRLRSSGGLTRR